MSTVETTETEIEFAPELPSVPPEPLYPELAKAAEIVRSRGLKEGDYGDYGGQRCTIGAVIEGMGIHDRIPAMKHPKTRDRYDQLYHALHENLPPVPNHPLWDHKTGDRGGLTVEEYSDLMHDVHKRPAPIMADILERTAYGL